MDVPEGQVPLATLDAAYVGSIQTDFIGKLFLRPPRFFAEFAYSVAECLKNVVFMNSDILFQDDDRSKDHELHSRRTLILRLEELTLTTLIR